MHVRRIRCASPPCGPEYPLIIHVIRDRGRSDNRREQLTDRLDKLAGLIAFGITEVEDIVITQRKPLR